MVLKLSGFAKFEVDHKFTSDHFYRMVMKLSTLGEEFNQELFEKHCTIFKRSFNEMQEYFKGNLEDELYKNCVASGVVPLIHLRHVSLCWRSLPSLQGQCQAWSHVARWPARPGRAVYRGAGRHHGARPTQQTDALW